MNKATTPPKKFTIKNKKKLAAGGEPDADDMDAAYAAANGGQPLSKGGMTQGPSHEEGGVDVYQKGAAEPTAEIEGGERVFSREDTELMEEACEKIISTQDKAKADELAMQLGYAVCQMIQQQEQNQKSMENESGGGEPDADDLAAMNEM